MRKKTASLRDDVRLAPLWAKLHELTEDVLTHSGFGEVHITSRWIKRGQKEVILSCGKQYRFLIQVPEAEDAGEEDGQ